MIINIINDNNNSNSISSNNNDNSNNNTITTGPRARALQLLEQGHLDHRKGQLAAHGGPKASMTLYYITVYYIIV